MERVVALAEERNRLEAALQKLTTEIEVKAALEGDWIRAKKRKQELADEFRAIARFSRLNVHLDPIENHLGKSVREFAEHQIKAEPYWFQKIEVLPGFYSPGWSDPAAEKLLPYFGLPEDLTNKRVLDIGCAEGFFSFEAERRGAREVIGIDSFPDSIRRFHVVKTARQSNASAFLMNVYDLEPKRLGTFDVVLFYDGLLSLEASSVCARADTQCVYRRPSLSNTYLRRARCEGSPMGSLLSAWRDVGTQSRAVRRDCFLAVQ
jgi:2-polyprenyl-3-methyl-5-hydroxy-6-metoxy-1,4-benzoquinol methylase